MRRITLLAVVAALFASSVWAQDGRSRRVQQRPAAAVSGPRAEPASSPLAFAAVPFAPGESLSYDVDWNGQTAAASVALSVGTRGTYFGQEGLPLSADVQTVGLVRMFASVNLSYKSYSNPRTLLPFRSDRDQSVNGKTDRGSVVFDREKSVAVANGASTPIGPDTGDPLAVLYRLRALPLKVGDTITLDYFAENKRQQVQAVVEAKESATTDLGRSNAIRVAIKPLVAGKPDDRNKIRLWLSDDAARLPLVVTAEPQFGAIRMTLTSANGTKH